MKRKWLSYSIQFGLGKESSQLTKWMVLIEFPCCDWWRFHLWTSNRSDMEGGIERKRLSNWCQLGQSKESLQLTKWRIAFQLPVHIASLWISDRPWTSKNMPKEKLMHSVRSFQLGQLLNSKKSLLSPLQRHSVLLKAGKRKENSIVFNVQVAILQWQRVVRK